MLNIGFIKKTPLGSRVDISLLAGLRRSNSCPLKETLEFSVP
jgi:hypothetical protein